MRTSQDAPLILALVALAAILFVSNISYPPPTVVPASGPDDQFSGARALVWLEQLVGDNLPHPAGSEQNAVVRGRIIDLLAQWGYETIEQHTERERWNGEVVPLVNLMVRIEGTHSGPAMMLACHHDSVPAGPGAADDGAAVAVTLEIARMLTLHPPLKHDLILLITDGEEFGLLGARQFVREHSWANEVAVVVNCEARGTSGPSMMFETSPQNYGLVRLFAQHVPHPRTSSLFYEVYKHLPNDTDFTIFRQAGMQGMNFAFIGDVANYHTPNDRVENLDIRSMQHHGENAWALINALGNGDLAMVNQNDNAVYFDVFGKFVVMWPENLALPIAILAAVISFLGIGRLLAIDPPDRLGTALWSFPASLIVAGIAAGCVMAGLELSPLFASGWPRHPAAVEFAAFAASLLALIGLATAVKRGRDSAVTASCWAGIAVLACAIAYWLPGGSYFFVIPLLVGGLVALVLSRTAWACLAPAGWTIALFAMCLPVERLFYDALGFQPPELLAGRLALLTSTLFPLVNTASKKMRFGLATACAVSFVGCLGYAAMW